MSENTSASITVKPESVSQRYEIVGDLSSVSFSFRPDLRGYGSDALQVVVDFKNGVEFTATPEATMSQDVELVFLKPVRDAQKDYVAHALTTPEASNLPEAQSVSLNSDSNAQMDRGKYALTTAA